MLNDFIFFVFHEPALSHPHEDTPNTESPALENLIEEVARAFRLEFSPALLVPGRF